jgi:hypothetical protein
LAAAPKSLISARRRRAVISRTRIRAPTRSPFGAAALPCLWCRPTRAAHFRDRWGKMPTRIMWRVVDDPDDPEAIREGVVVYSSNPRAAYQRQRRYRLRLRHTVHAPDGVGGSCRVCHKPWPCPTPFKQAEIPWGPGPPSSTSWTPDDMDQARAFVESILAQAFHAGLQDEPTRLAARWSGDSALLRLANHWRREGSQGLPLTMPDAD